jgi:hypothetical protein
MGKRKTQPVLVESSQIEAAILLIRGQKVMLAADLAELYGVPVKTLNQAVKRNSSRFPPDFMFQLTWDEVASMPSHFARSGGAAKRSRSQIVTLKQGRNVKFRPYAFTEQGVAMLSSVLRSPRAIQMNVEIMRVFVRMRQILGAHADLAAKLQDLEKNTMRSSARFSTPSANS